MPVPKSRDPELARRDLEAWVAQRLPDASDVRITRFEMPRTSGFSNETMLFDVDHDGDRLELVARVAPATYVLFPDYDLDRQRRVIEALASSPVPVPRVLWSGDAADSPFGQAFFVMERVDGRAAEDLPPYTKQGWLFDAPPDEQREVYVDGLRQVVAVADLDWQTLGLDLVDDRAYGRPGAEQELAYWLEFHRWVVGGRDIPLLADSFAWLQANVPDPRPVRFSWGDSRPGNILFRGGRAVAVLDWEMACLCPREADLAWWLTYQLVQTVGYGVADLPGFPGHDEAVALYEDLAGESVCDLGWWEQFSAFKLAVILLKLGDMMKTVGLVPPDSSAVERPTFRTLEHLGSRT